MVAVVARSRKQYIIFHNKIDSAKDKNDMEKPRCCARVMRTSKARSNSWERFAVCS